MISDCNYPKSGLFSLVPRGLAYGLASILWFGCVIAVPIAIKRGWDGRCKDWPVLEVVDFQHMWAVPDQFSTKNVFSNAFPAFARQLHLGNDRLSKFLQMQWSTNPVSYRILTNYGNVDANEYQTNLIVALNEVVTNSTLLKQADTQVEFPVEGENLERAFVRFLSKSFPGLVKAKFRAEAIAPGLILIVYEITLLVLLMQFLHLFLRERTDCNAFESAVQATTLNIEGFTQSAQSELTRSASRAKRVVDCGLRHGELIEALPGDAALDAASIGGSYTSVRVYIWVLPVLGFIGTAMGLSEAIEGFKSALQPGANLDTLMKALNTNVIPGLAASFYVTIIALLGSAVGHFCLTMLHAWDEALLERLDRACLQLLRRLASGSSPPNLDALNKLLKDGNEAAQTLSSELERVRQAWYKLGAPPDGKS